MKKLLQSKTLYLFLLIVINTIVLIALCVTTYSSTEVGTTYISSGTSEVEPTSSSRYLIESRNFTMYDSYDAVVSDYDYMYSTYVVDDTDIELGNEISKGDVLGEYGGIEIVSEYDSFCIDTIDNETSKEIVTYNYNSFLITIELSPSAYRSAEFDTLSGIYVNVDDIFYSTKFEGYDYSSFSTENIIEAKFITTNCNTLVNHNSICSIEVAQQTYTAQICVDASLYDSQLFSKLFYVIDGDSIISIYVDSFAIVEDYALISCSSYTLTEGMYLYTYE